ncbi:hypothetical protein [Ralstonia psammae]|uniref:hypothetical protein n=1 Tax=Ralstonia psammae TaxID=3058598 RepID=UPI00292EFF3B|nr:hypothetical protein [Ralstonia sp. LMG 19083]
MDLIGKVRLYQDRGRYFAVLVAPDTMCSSTGRNAAEALANLGRSLAEGSQPQTVEFSIEPKERKRRSPVGGHTPNPREFPRAIPLVKRLLNERFGKATLRELSDKLGLEGVTPQLLSSSIAGAGARRVRLAIAKALEEDPDALWPMARH